MNVELTMLTYSAGLLMGKTRAQWKKKLYLLASLSSNFGILFAFKYFNFFNEVLRTPLTLHLLLPVGISFYTFQSVSYAIDVYRGTQKPEPDFLVFALYVSFFPQLVAGPIERSAHMLPQYHRKISLRYENLAEGLRLILWGMFKKIVIADRLALYVENVYGKNYAFYSSASYLVATYFFFLRFPNLL